jgi:hypothetical protein
MSKLIASLLVLFFLSSCGVKEREPVNTAPAIQTQDKDLPAAVMYTANKKFLVKSSVEQIQVGDENKSYVFQIDYAVSTTALIPLTDNYLVEVKYGMPSMPQMKIRPAVISYPEVGKVSVIYAIDMAQDWRMEIKISKKDGTLEDTITYNYYIPE